MSNPRKKGTGFTFEQLDQVIFLAKTKGCNGPQIYEATGIPKNSVNLILRLYDYATYGDYEKVIKIFETNGSKKLKDWLVYRGIKLPDDFEKRFWEALTKRSNYMAENYHRKTEGIYNPAKRRKGSLIAYEDFDRILFYSKIKGLSGPDIAAELGCSVSTVNKFLKVYDSAKAGNFDEVYEVIKSYGSFKLKEYVEVNFNVPADFDEKADAAIKFRNERGVIGAGNEPKPLENESLSEPLKSGNLAELLAESNFILTNTYNTFLQLIRDQNSKLDVLNSTLSEIGKNMNEEFAKVIESIICYLSADIKAVSNDIDTNFDVLIQEQKKNIECLKTTMKKNMRS